MLIIAMLLVLQIDRCFITANVAQFSVEFGISTFKIDVVNLQRLRDGGILSCLDDRPSSHKLISADWALSLPESVKCLFIKTWQEAHFYQKNFCFGDWELHRLANGLHAATQLVSCELITQDLAMPMFQGVHVITQISIL